MARNLAASILELLDHERTDLRLAAATVLGAVGLKDDAVVEALVARLADEDAGVRAIALDAVARSGASGLAAKLVPLLRGDDPELAERAAELLAAQGAAAEGVLRRELGGGTVQVRRRIAVLLLTRASQAAIDALLAQLVDAELGEQVLQLLRAEIDKGNQGVIDKVEAGAAKRADEIGKDVKKALAKLAPRGKPAKAKKGKAVDVAPAPFDPALETAIGELAMMLRLIGYLARPSTMAMLLGYVDEAQPRTIRLAAIAGLRRVLAIGEAKHVDKALARMIELADGDDAAVAQAAVDTLRGVRVPDSLAKPFAALAKSKHAATQKLAMERMPAAVGATGVRALIDALGGADPAAREAAARGLARAPEAAGPLAKAVLAVEEGELARRLAAALKLHREKVTGGMLDELAARGALLLERQGKGKASAEEVLIARVLTELVADLSPSRHVGLLFDQARRLRKAGRVPEAFAVLKPLVAGRPELDAAIDDDQRFTIAVLGLESLGQGILRPTGADAPVLAQFGRLAQRGFPVARKLAREKEVGDEDIYALGFRLLEGRDAIDQELGAELMQGLIDERPRSKLAKNAKNKLKLAGYADA
jgi:hypothetical protein